MFVEAGAQVVIGDVLDEEGALVAKDLGTACTYVHHDVSDPAHWEAAVATTIASYGGLDVLVNNAGIFRITPIASTSVERYLRVVNVNQVGTFLGIQAAAAAMGTTGGGSIINISSVMGLRGGPGMVAYSATKFAIRGMTKCAALELAPVGIRVNSVHPGVIDTPMLGDMLPMAGGKEQLGARLPVGALSEPEDIGHIVVFLASDESRHCTGAEFVVDGGVTVGLGVA